MKDSSHLDLAGFGKNTKQASDLPFPLPLQKREKTNTPQGLLFYNNVERFIA